MRLMLNSTLCLIELAAFGNGANRLAQPQGRYPKGSEERRTEPLVVLSPCMSLSTKQEKIDIGVREQLAPAVSTHGKHGHAVGKRWRQMRAERVRHELVDKRASAKDGRGRVASHDGTGSVSTQG